jgi:phosphoribosyl-dephospho-CoA transferase
VLINPRQENPLQFTGLDLEVEIWIIRLWSKVLDFNSAIIRHTLGSMCAGPRRCMYCEDSAASVVVRPILKPLVGMLYSLEVRRKSVYFLLEIR